MIVLCLRRDLKYIYIPVHVYWLEDRTNPVLQLHTGTPLCTRHICEQWPLFVVHGLRTVW